MKKIKSLSVLIAVFLAIIGGSAYLFFSGKEKVFPVLQSAGSYIGKFKVDINELEFFVYKDPAGGNAVLAFSDEHWKSDIKGNTYSVVSPQGVFILYGEENKPGEYEGSVNDSQGKMVGEWSLTALPENKNLQSIQEVQSLNQLLNLSSALQEIEAKIEVQQSTINQQKLEVERLSEYLTEGQAFRTNADKKYKQKKTELEELQAVKAGKLKEAEQLREKFDISQRLFGTGKLVYLSRNTLDLEKRWFDSMYTSSGIDNDADFENLVARAERILLLKKEISYELNKFGGGNE